MVGSATQRKTFGLILVRKPVKETRIKQIRFDWERGPEENWSLHFSSRSQNQLPRELGDQATQLFRWANANHREDIPIVLRHLGRWSMVAWCQSDSLIMVALAKPDFALHFAGDPFRLVRFLGKPQGDAHLPDGSLVVEAEWGDLPEIAYFQELLKTEDSALLLGGAQALVDGGKIQLGETPQDRFRAENLWNLIPIPVRMERTVVVGDKSGDWPSDLAAAQSLLSQDSWTAQRLGDYPEGRFEFSLHSAIDLKDEEGVYRLLHRKSPRQVMMMATMLLVGMIIIGFLMSW